MSAGEWVFEGADPEVGLLTDDIVHCCEENNNVDESAFTKDVSFTNQPDGKLVTQHTTFECPACGATTTCTEQYPRWMFEEPRDEHEGR